MINSLSLILLTNHSSRCVGEVKRLKYLLQDTLISKSLSFIKLGYSTEQPEWICQEHVRIIVVSSSTSLCSPSWLQYGTDGKGLQVQAPGDAELKSNIVLHGLGTCLQDLVINFGPEWFFLCFLICIISSSKCQVLIEIVDTHTLK